MAKYTLGELIARGGMGQVHHAQDRSGRAVVVKRVRDTLHGDPGMTDRLLGEARLLERIIHHNVVRAVDHGCEDGRAYLVMAPAAGMPLRKVIERDGAMPVQRAFGIAAQIVAGLAAIHDEGVVHADMESSNVLVDDNDRVTIVDFGLARAGTAELDRAAIANGTPAFMAPEVIAGCAPTVATDVYAVGALLYEMLTGTTPFAGAPDVFAAHLREPVLAPSRRAPNAGLTAAVDAVVLRALEKLPSARFKTARELGAALDEIVAEEWSIPTRHLWSQRTRELVPDTRPTRDVTHVDLEVVPAAAEALQVHDKISATLLRAQALVEGHDPRAAIDELERGLAALSPDGESLPAEVWRIETVLAALSDALGKKERARRVAMAAANHAAATGCKVAAARTRALVDRLEPKRPGDARVRLAKGSAQHRRR